jgi:hypothetical protein
MTVEIRYATLEDYPRIRQFLDQYWRKDHVYVRDSRLFDWTFKRTDTWDRQGYSCVLAEDKGKTVGTLGGIPFIFNCLGRSSQGIWYANLLLHPLYRKGPLFIRMFKMFQRPPYDLNAVAGMTAHAAELYDKLGWTVCANIPRHLIVLPHRVNRMGEVLRLTCQDWPWSKAQALARFFSGKLYSPNAGPIFDEVPPSWDEADWPHIARKSVGAARVRSYLRWRYCEHPSFKYNFIVILEGERSGLVVWRLETIRRATPEGLIDVDRIGRVVEFLPTSLPNARALLSCLLSDLNKADAIAADYYGYHGEIGRWLNTIGFLGVDSHPDGKLVPARFQPLDLRGGYVRSAVLGNHTIPRGFGDQNCVWYWTRSDSDQDRPN